MKSNIYYRENDDGGVLTCILAHSVPSSFCFYHTFKLYRLHFTVTFYIIGNQNL